MYRFRKSPSGKCFLASLLILIVLCFSLPVSAASYYQPLSGKYTGGIPSRYKTQSEFTSDSQFANWRVVYGESIGKGALYRSRIPGTTSYGRIADRQAKQAKVNYIINLCETPKALKSRLSESGASSLYYTSLWKKGKVLAQELEGPNIAYKTVSSKRRHRKELAACMKAIANNRGPYLVHCTMGKDRTGELCIIAAALCGASYNELLRDYRQSYRNYCIGISDAKITAFCKKNLDYLLQIYTYEASGTKWTGMNFTPKIRRYLLNGGMTSTEINLAIKHLKANYR